jgi:hypothetical protein
MIIKRKETITAIPNKGKMTISEENQPKGVEIALPCHLHAALGGGVIEKYERERETIRTLTSQVPPIEYQPFCEEKWI